MLDKYFAIQHVGDKKYEMGTKAVEIDENSDIIVDRVKYDGTTGLWALVMMNDLPEWLYIFPLLKTLPSPKYDNTNHDDDEDDTAFEDSSQHTKWLNKDNGGDGIQLLPSDIKGLKTKLNYLLA